MRRFCAVAAILVGVLFSVGGKAAARPPEDEQGEDALDRSRARLDTSLDLTSTGGLSGMWSGTVAPFGPLGRSGPRLLGQAAVSSQGDGEGDALAGYAWVRGEDLGLSLALGASVQSDPPGRADPGSPPPGVRWGAKVVLESYASPSARVFLHGLGSCATAGPRYYVHLEAGYAFFGGMPLGPEVLFLGDDRHAEWRAGVHLTGIELGPAELDVSAGYLHERGAGSGAYGLSSVGVSF
jgi:hypothetical protein